MALGLASEIAHLGAPTLLIDADVFGGTVAASLAMLDESSGLLSAARSGNAGSLDAAVLAGQARQITPMLRVLTGLPRADRWPQLRPSPFAGVLSAARALVPFVVVDLGFCIERDEELSFDTAIEDCLPVWRRRYGFEVGLAIERIDLPPEMAGDLFRIAQEAVVNAGRHAEATRVEISLRRVGTKVELRVADNGHGFGSGNGMERLNGYSSEPGHLGLASMRERAELLDGGLTIESSERGTKLVVLAPLEKRRLLKRSRFGR